MYKAYLEKDQIKKVKGNIPKPNFMHESYRMTYLASLILAVS